MSFHDTGGVAFHGRLRIAICGHVDTHGASTGRLIFELESLSECEKDRLEQEALELHQSRAGFFHTFCHCYQNWLEKDYERARTNANTRKEFTDKSHYTIIEDALLEAERNLRRPGWRSDSGVARDGGVIQGAEPADEQGVHSFLLQGFHRVLHIHQFRL